MNNPTATIDSGRLARELAESLERYRAILDTAVDAIITISEQGAIETFNRAAERIFGYASAEIVGRNVCELMPEPDRSQHDAYLERYLAGGEPHIIGIGREVRGRRKDGGLFPMELSIGEVRLPQRRLFTGIARDISDRKAIEAESRQRLAELAHAGRVAAMGEMATALAHEVNQPLTAIITHSGACLRMLDDAAPKLELLRESLRQISRQGERAGEVIKRLRSFVRRGETELRPVDLNGVVRGVLTLIAHEMQAQRVELHLALDAGLPPVSMDAVQVQQVVFNLVQNALEAMARMPAEHPRDLHLQTGATVLDGRPAVAFIATDNGPGLGGVDPEQLFQPYYTTRPEGMGQGLAICRTIVRYHDGCIGAEPAPGGGARLRMVLPVDRPQDG